jgi:hypothetical protein
MSQPPLIRIWSRIYLTGMTILLGLNLSLCVESPAILSQDQMQKILSATAAHQLENSEKRYQYTYAEKEIVEELGAEDKVKKSETKTYAWRHTEFDSFLKLLTLNGASYDSSYWKLQDDKIRQTMLEEDRKSEAEKNQMRIKARQDREEETALFRNLTEAFVFKPLAREIINGSNAWVLEFSPRPGFMPQNRESRLLKGLFGKIWITVDQSQLIRLAGTLEEDVDYGIGIFGSLKRGSTVTLEQEDIGNGLWFPTFTIITYKANLLIKGTHERKISHFSNYQFNPEYFRRQKTEAEKL